MVATLQTSTPAGTGWAARRGRWLDYLAGEIRFGQAIEGPRGRGSGLFACQRWRLTGGVGRPARGESLRSTYGCQSLLCVYCRNGSAWSGPAAAMKARHALLALGSQEWWGYSCRPIDYVLVTLTPPAAKSRFLWLLAVPEESREAQNLLVDLESTSPHVVPDVLRRRALAGFEALHWGAPRYWSDKNPLGGIFYHTYRTKNAQIEQKLFASSIRRLRRLAVGVLRQWLRGLAGVGGAEFGLEARVGLLSSRGLYPHVHVLIPLVYRAPDQAGKLVWQRLPLAAVLSARRGLEQVWREAVWNVLGLPVPSVPKSIRWMYEEDLWVGAYGEVHYAPECSLWHTHVRDVRAGPGDPRWALARAINYLCEDELVAPYRSLCLEPLKMPRKAQLIEAINYVLRRHIMFPGHARLLSSFGFLAARNAGKTLFGMLNLGNRSPWAGRPPRDLLEWLRGLVPAKVSFAGTGLGGILEEEWLEALEDEITSLEQDKGLPPWEPGA